MRQILAVTVITIVLGCAGQGQPSPKTETRDEFKAKVMGKTEAELLESVGTPDRTSQSNSGKSWVWKARTHDPVTGKVDTSVQVLIDGRTGKVKSVYY